MKDKEARIPSLITLPHYGYLHVAGEKAAAFLQGQLTCDLHQLRATHTLWGAYLNLQGRIITTVRVIYFHDQLYLQLPLDLLNTVQTKLTKLAMLSRVTVTDVTQQWLTVGVLATVENGWPNERYGAHALTEACTVLKTSLAEQYMLIGKPESVQTLCHDTGYDWGNTTDWLRAQIQQTIVEVDEEISGKFTPHEINLPQHDGVSFTKGCYVGQEIVARMQYRGKLKKQLMLARGSIDELASMGEVVKKVMVSDGEWEGLVLQKSSDISQ